MFSDYPNKCPKCDSTDLILIVDNGSLTISYNLIDGYIDEDSEDMDFTESEEPQEYIECPKCDKKVYEEVKTWEKIE